MPSRLSSSTGNNGGSGSSFNITITTAQNRGMVAFISLYNNSVTVSSITQTNCTWTRAIQSTVASSGTTEVWYCLSAGSSPGTTATVTLSGTNSGAGGTIAVYDTPFTSVDKTATSSGTSSTAPNTGTTATSTSTNELFAGCCSIIDTGGAGYSFGTMSNSFSTITEVDFQGTSLAGPFLHHGAFQYISSSLQTAGSTAQFTSVNYTGAVATLVFGAAVIATARRRINSSFL